MVFLRVKTMMNWKTTLALASIALLFVTPQISQADIYQYTDDNGVIHFSNVGVGKTVLSTKE